MARRPLFRSGNERRLRWVSPARVGRQSATHDDRLFDQLFWRKRLPVRWKPSSTNAPWFFDLSGLKQPMKECAGGRPRGILVALADFPDVVKQVARLFRVSQMCFTEVKCEYFLLLQWVTSYLVVPGTHASQLSACIFLRYSVRDSGGNPACQKRPTRISKRRLASVPICILEHSDVTRSPLLRA